MVAVVLGKEIPHARQRNQQSSQQQTGGRRRWDLLCDGRIAYQAIASKGGVGFCRVPAACVCIWMWDRPLTASVRSVTPETLDRAVSHPLWEDPALARLLLVVSPSPVFAVLLLVVSPALVFAVVLVLFAEDILARSSSPHQGSSSSHSNNETCRPATSDCKLDSVRRLFMIAPRLP